MSKFTLFLVSLGCATIGAYFGLKQDFSEMNNNFLRNDSKKQVLKLDNFITNGTIGLILPLLFETFRNNL